MAETTCAEAMEAMTNAERRVEELRATCTAETLGQFREAQAEYERVAAIAHDLKWREIHARRWADRMARLQRNTQQEREPACLS